MTNTKDAKNLLGEAYPGVMPIELFFLAFYKNGAVQHLCAGPFIDEEGAIEDRAAHKYSAERYRVLRVQLNAEVMDIEGETNG